MKELVTRFVKETEGQDMIEYSLLAAFISIVAWLVVRAIGVDVENIYTDVNTTTTDAAAAN